MRRARKVASVKSWTLPKQFRRSLVSFCNTPNVFTVKTLADRFKDDKLPLQLCFTEFLNRGGFAALGKVVRSMCKTTSGATSYGPAFCACCEIARKILDYSSPSSILRTALLRTSVLELLMQTSAEIQELVDEDSVFMDAAEALWYGARSLVDCTSTNNLRDYLESTDTIPDAFLKAYSAFFTKEWHTEGLQNDATRAAAIPQISILQALKAALDTNNGVHLKDTAKKMCLEIMSQSSTLPPHSVSSVVNLGMQILSTAGVSLSFQELRSIVPSLVKVRHDFNTHSSVALLAPLLDQVTTAAIAHRELEDVMLLVVLSRHRSFATELQSHPQLQALTELIEQEDLPAETRICLMEIHSNIVARGEESPDAVLAASARALKFLNTAVLSSDTNVMAGDCIATVLRNLATSSRRWAQEDQQRAAQLLFTTCGDSAVHLHTDAVWAVLRIARHLKADPQHAAFVLKIAESCLAPTKIAKISSEFGKVINSLAPQFASSLLAGGSPASKLMSLHAHELIGMAPPEALHTVTSTLASLERLSQGLSTEQFDQSVSKMLTLKLLGHDTRTVLGEQDTTSAGVFLSSHVDELEKAGFFTKTVHQELFDTVDDLRSLDRVVSRFLTKDKVAAAVRKLRTLYDSHMFCQPDAPPPQWSAAKSTEAQRQLDILATYSRLNPHLVHEAGFTDLVVYSVSGSISHGESTGFPKSALRKANTKGAPGLVAILNQQFSIVDAIVQAMITVDAADCVLACHEGRFFSGALQQILKCEKAKKLKWFEHPCVFLSNAILTFNKDPRYLRQFLTLFGTTELTPLVATHRILSELLETYLTDSSSLRWLSLFQSSIPATVAMLESTWFESCQIPRLTLSDLCGVSFELARLAADSLSSASIVQLLKISTIILEAHPDIETTTNAADVLSNLAHALQIVNDTPHFADAHNYVIRILKHWAPPSNFEIEAFFEPLRGLGDLSDSSLDTDARLGRLDRARESLWRLDLMARAHGHFLPSVDQLHSMSAALDTLMDIESGPLEDALVDTLFDLLLITIRGGHKGDQSPETLSHIAALAAKHLAKRQSKTAIACLSFVVAHHVSVAHDAELQLSALLPPLSPLRKEPQGNSLYPVPLIRDSISDLVDEIEEAVEVPLVPLAPDHDHDTAIEDPSVNEIDLVDVDSPEPSARESTRVAQELCKILAQVQSIPIDDAFRAVLQFANDGQYKTMVSDLDSSEISVATDLSYTFDILKALYMVAKTCCLASKRVHYRKQATVILHACLGVVQAAADVVLRRMADHEVSATAMALLSRCASVYGHAFGDATIAIAEFRRHADTLLRLLEIELTSSTPQEFTEENLVHTWNCVAKCFVGTSKLDPHRDFLHSAFMKFIGCKQQCFRREAVAMALSMNVTAQVICHQRITNAAFRDAAELSSFRGRGHHYNPPLTGGISVEECRTLLKFMHHTVCTADKSDTVSRSICHCMLDIVQHLCVFSRIDGSVEHEMLRDIVGLTPAGETNIVETGCFGILEGALSHLKLNGELDANTANKVSDCLAQLSSEFERVAATTATDLSNNTIRSIDRSWAELMEHCDDEQLPSDVLQVGLILSRNSFWVGSLQMSTRGIRENACSYAEVVRPLLLTMRNCLRTLSSKSSAHTLQACLQLLTNLLSHVDYYDTFLGLFCMGIKPAHNNSSRSSEQRRILSVVPMLTEVLRCPQSYACAQMSLVILERCTVWARARWATEARDEAQRIVKTMKRCDIVGALLGCQAHFHGPSSEFVLHANQTLLGVDYLLHAAGLRE